MSTEHSSFARQAEDALRDRRGSLDWRVEHRESVDSTMLEARRLVGTGAGSGVAVIADFQEAGRGRRERVFVSPRGGLYVTAILAGPPRVEDAWRLGFAGALAAARALNEAGVEALRFEWPNDLFVRTRKVGGVLAELLTGAALPGRGPGSLVLVGVGLNTGPDPSEVAPELAGPAGAFELAGDSSRPRLCARFLRELEGLSTLVAEPRGWRDVLQSVRNLSSLRGQEPVRVRRHDGSELRGIPWDILEDGSLELYETTGELTRVRYGEVVHD